MRFKHLHSQVKQSSFAVFSVLLSTCTESPSSVNPLGNMRFREPTGFVQYSESRSGPVFSVAARQVIFSFRPSANQVERDDIQNWLISQGARRIGFIDAEIPTYQYAINSNDGLLSTLQHLRSEPSILFASPNFQLTSLRDPNPPLNYNIADGSWWINTIGAREAWEVTQGSTLPIAIIDRGADYSSIHFRRKPVRVVVKCYESESEVSFIESSRPVDECRGVRTYRYSEDPHGTQVASLVGSRGDDGIPSVGVAWENPLIFVDLFGGTSTTLLHSTAATSAAIRLGAKIINLSVGPSYFCPDPLNSTQCHQDALTSFRETLLPAVYSAVQNNVLLVFAAGNSGFREDDVFLSRRHMPSSDLEFFRSNVIFVGGVDDLENPTCNIDYYLETRLGEVACISNPLSCCSRIRSRCDCFSCLFPRAEYQSVEGRVVEISAPGYRLSLANTSDPSGGTTPLHFRYLQSNSGTSFSAPLVSGAAALVWSVNPNLMANQVKEILLDTARRSNGCRQIGRGILDAAAAVRRARDMASPSMDAGVTPDASTDVQTDSTADSSEVITGTPVSIGRTYWGGYFSQVRFAGGAVIASGVRLRTNRLGNQVHNVVFARFDPLTQNLLWQREIDLGHDYLVDGPFNALDLKPTSNGFASAFVTYSPSPTNLVLVRMTSDGNLVYLNDLSRDTSMPPIRLNRFSRLFPQSDDSILLISGTTLAMPLSGLQDQTALTRFDSSGRFSWSRLFYTSETSHLGNFPILDSYVSSSNATVFYSGNSLTSDLSGNNLNASSHAYFPFLRLSFSRGYLFGVTNDQVFEDGGVSSAFVRFDSTGTVASTTPFHVDSIDPSLLFFNDFNSTSDGFILSVSGGVFTNSPSPVLVRFDSTGRVLWQRSYGPSGSNISGVMQTEGGFIAVGQYYSERSSDASSWIFSVDSEGNPR